MASPTDALYPGFGLYTNTARESLGTQSDQLPLLPEEIIDLVCSHINAIQYEDSTSDHGYDHTLEQMTLLSLFRASRMTYRIARPYLYRVLRVETRRYGQRQLLLTLLKNPHLVREVRQFQLIGSAWKIRPWDYHGKRSRLTAKDKETGLLALRRLQALDLLPTTRGDIWRGVEEGKEDSEIACIIAICPYIEALQLPIFPSFHFSQVQIVVGHTLLQVIGRNTSSSSRTPLPLSCLERLSINTPHTIETRDGMMDFSEIGQMMSLPGLRTLHAHNIDLRGWEKGTQYCPSGLQTAYLTYVRPNSSGIAKFLQRCPSLQVLHLPSIRFYSEYIGMPLEDFGASLNQYGTNLRYIEMSAPGEHLKREPTKALGVLTNLRNLLSLKVTELLLFGHQCRSGTDRPSEFDFHSSFSDLSSTLPSNLQTLEIDGTGNRPQIPAYGEHIIDLVSDTCHASLERVCFPRHRWADNLLQQTNWTASGSTETKIAIERPM